HRLDDVVGAGFAVITSTPLGPRAEASLRQRGIVVLVAQPGGELATWLRYGRATAAIVRPDRTVMRAGRDVAALCAWMLTTVGRRSTASESNAGLSC
ncbi:MAG TPA: hypothetical protein VE441_09960, partial [Mycobacterium sp.]|nr:hypothetical protein [Mycobacterium sp.]